MRKNGQTAKKLKLFYENAGKWEIMNLIFNLDSDWDIKFFDFQLFPSCFARTLVTSFRLLEWY